MTNKPNKIDHNSAHFKALKKDWDQLRALVQAGNINPVDNAIELKFMQENNNSPVDTLLEINEQKFMNALRGFADNPYSKEVQKAAKDLLTEIKNQPLAQAPAPEAELDAENTFKPGV